MALAEFKITRECNILDPTARALLVHNHAQRRRALGPKMARTVAAMLLRLLSSSVNLEKAVNFLKILISH